MIHATTKDMADFNAVQLPLTPAEKVARQKAAKDPSASKYCPFCQREFTGTPGINNHLSSIIRKGGDDKHNVEASNEWSAKSRQIQTRQAMAGEAIGRRKRGQRMRIRTMLKIPAEMNPERKSWKEEPAQVTCLLKPIVKELTRW
jgi:hypothetical protein